LHGCKGKGRIRIALDNKINRAVTKITDAIKYNYVWLIHLSLLPLGIIALI